MTLYRSLSDSNTVDGAHKLKLLKSQIHSNSNPFLGPPTAIAGLFIGAQIDFGKGLDWLHVDLAGPAFSDRATGYGPALLTSLLSEHIDVEVAKMA